MGCRFGYARLRRASSLLKLFTGTSMSTPYLAGVAALLLEAKIPARQIRSLLQATASGIPISNKMNALPASLAYQGAGIVNVGAALKAVTSISPTELLLNDTANWKRECVLSFNRVLTAKLTCFTATSSQSRTTARRPRRMFYSMNQPAPSFHSQTPSTIKCTLFLTSTSLQLYTSVRTALQLPLVFRPRSPSQSLHRLVLIQKHFL